MADVEKVSSGGELKDEELEQVSGGTTGNPGFLGVGLNNPLQKLIHSLVNNTPEPGPAPVFSEKPSIQVFD